MKPLARCKKGFGHDHTGKCVNCELLAPNNWETTCRNVPSLAGRIGKSIDSKSAKNHLSRIIMFICIRIHI